MKRSQAAAQPMLRGIEHRVIRSNLGNHLARIAVVAAAQFAAGKLGYLLVKISGSGIAPVWPASGIALGALLFWGYSVWPGVAVGALLLGLFLSPLPNWAVVVYAAGSTSAALAAAFLLSRVANFDRSLSRLRDVLALIVFGAVVSSLVSACLGVPALDAGYLRRSSGFLPVWLIYSLGDGMGVLLVTPVILTFSDLLKMRSWDRLAELLGMLFLITVVCFIIFGGLRLPMPLDILAFAVLPFVIGAAIRFGVSGVALTTLWISVIATTQTVLGYGPFASNNRFLNAVLLDVFFVVLAITGLTLAAAIAERRQAEREREELVREQAGREARLRLAAIVESSDDAILSKDLAGVIVSWNASAERIFGFSEAEAIGQPTTIIIPPERWDQEKEILQRVASGEEIEHREMERVTKSGKRVDVSLSISPIKEATGDVVGAAAIIRDITEQKRAQEALKKSEEKFSKAFRESPMALTLTRAKDHRYLDVNETFERFIGWRRDEVIGRTPFDLGIWVNPSEREAFVKRLLTGEVIRDLEFRYRRKDGAEMVGLGSAELIEIENEPCVLSVVADITERKRAEAAVKESESRFRLLADTAPVLVWMSGTDKLCTYFNKPWLDFTGRPFESALGSGWTEGIHSEDAQRCLDTYAHAFDQQQKLSMEYRLRRHDGEYRWILDIGVPRFNEDGAFAGYIGACVDVTERRQAEEAIAGVGRKLIQAQEQERTRIARDLHDDIGQQLALLAIELGQLQKSLPDSQSELRTRVAALQGQIKQVSTDVQTISHELHSSKIEYLGIVAAMKGFCKEFSTQRNVEVQFTSQDVPAHLSPEISLCLFRVLQEALHNSAKHSGVGRFKAELIGNTDELHLTISDSGCGFDPQAATNLNGLGLVSMRERIRLVNGTITIDSKLMSGTTVRVRVPLSSSSRSASV